MRVLLWSGVLSSCAWLLHFVIWKLRLPQRHTRAILLIFFGVTGGGLFGLWILQAWQPAVAKGFLPVTCPEYLHILLFSTAVTLAYIITYSALEADSPSLVMILTIARAGQAGLPQAQLYQQLTDERLILPRLQDLVRDELVTLQGEKYRLTPKGRRFVWIFRTYRQLLALAAKGG
jgi:hypothetical protein